MLISSSGPCFKKKWGYKPLSVVVFLYLDICQGSRPATMGGTEFNYRNVLLVLDCHRAKEWKMLIFLNFTKLQVHTCQESGEARRCDGNSSTIRGRVLGANCGFAAGWKYQSCFHSLQRGTLQASLGATRLCFCKICL